MAGSFVVSLDMELMWGVRSGRTKDQYGHRVLGERLARHPVPIDMPTAIAKVKLLRAVRDARQAETAPPQAADAA